MSIECFRRAVEFGLSVKRATASRFKSWPSRQMAGCPGRLLSVATFRRVAGLGYRSKRAWSRVRVPPPDPCWPCASTRGSSAVEHVNSQFDFYPSALSAGRGSWIIGTRQQRFNSAPPLRRRWCNASTLGNSTVVLLPAQFRWAEVRGLSRVVGSSPIAGS